MQNWITPMYSSDLNNDENTKTDIIVDFAKNIQSKTGPVTFLAIIAVVLYLIFRR